MSDKLHFRYSVENPFHISIGAVLVNDEGKVRVHRFTPDTVPKTFLQDFNGLESIVILMRESLENNETLEQAVTRGIQEEFGAEGELEKYLGSEQCFIRTPRGDFEKTTLYFQMRFIRDGLSRHQDAESSSTLEWAEPEALIEQMKKQGKATGRGDLDESKIIEGYLKYRHV